MRRASADGSEEKVQVNLGNRVRNSISDISYSKKVETNAKKDGKNKMSSSAIYYGVNEKLTRKQGPATYKSNGSSKSRSSVKREITQPVRAKASATTNTSNVRASKASSNARNKSKTMRP